MERKQVEIRTRLPLIINILYLTFLKLPYIFISVTFAFDFDLSVGMIICCLIDLFTWLVTIPMFLFVHGQGLMYSLIALFVALAAISSEGAIIYYQLDQRNKCTTTDNFWKFNCYVTYTVNIVFIVAGFMQPVALMFSSFFNLSSTEPIEERPIRRGVNKKVDELISESSKSKLLSENI